MFLIVVYLLAIVIANLNVSLFQAYAVQLLTAVTLINAAMFIALDLTTRDTLHERWQGRVWRNMFRLVFAGSALSALTVFAFNALFGLGLSASAPLASFAAFAAAGIADTFIYQLLHRQPRWIKMIGSNTVSAAVDSLVFPILAFVVLAPVMPLEAALTISWWQFVAKFGGGVVWTIILNSRFARRFEAQSA